MNRTMRKLSLGLAVPIVALPLLCGGFSSARAASENYGQCASQAAKGDGSNKAFTDENKPPKSNGNKDEPPASCSKP